MKHVIPKHLLDAAQSCGDHLQSPEWSDEEQALVYSDLEATVRRLAATEEGRVQLRWLVTRSLLPLDASELERVITATAHKRPFEPPSIVELDPDDPRVELLNAELDAQLEQKRDQANAELARQVEESQAKGPPPSVPPPAEEP